MIEANSFSPEQSEALMLEQLERYREHPSSTWEIYEFYGLTEGMDAEAEEREAQKQAFLRGDIRNPQIRYPRLDGLEMEDSLVEAEQSLIDLAKAIDDSGATGTRAELAAEIPGTRHLEVWALQVSKIMQEQDLAPEQVQEYKEMYNLINDSVYGELEVDRFAGLLVDTRQQAESLLQDENEEVREAAQYIIERTGDMQGVEAKAPFVPSQDTIDSLQDLIKTKFADLLEILPDLDSEEKISIEQLADIFRKAHEIRQTGWDTKIDPDKANVDTRQSEKATYIGAKRKLGNAMNAAKVLIHENGVHVERRVRGDNLGDPLLSGDGLANRLANEEGTTTVLEQILEGKSKIAGRQYYTMLGLARGMDGKGERDFRDIFELEWRRQALEDYADNGSFDATKAQKTAYTKALRIFRGTPMGVPGMVYSKDQAYFMGNQEMWEVFATIAELPLAEQQKYLDVILAAKTNPVDERHQEVLHTALEKAIA